MTLTQLKEKTYHALDAFLQFEADLQAMNPRVSPASNYAQGVYERLAKKSDKVVQRYYDALNKNPSATSTINFMFFDERPRMKLLAAKRVMSERNLLQRVEQK